MGEGIIIGCNNCFSRKDKTKLVFVVILQEQKERFLI